MAGLYIHIPFCRQKCHYCNFYTVISQRYRKQFISALKHELELQKNYLENQQVNTIYFGGGTPSMLSTNEIISLIDTVSLNYNVNSDVEITLEANPDDLSSDYLRQIKNETPINRFSLGVQSFYDDDLAYLNRIHNGKHARNAIYEALKLGFNNLTIDLIYGIPTLTNEKWKTNLQTFFDFGLPHLSSYALTVEPKTNLQVLIDKQKIAPTLEDQTVDHFEILLEQTEKKGFIHYEISNFALPGYYSKHNSIYWLGGHYVGVGPSAHSFNGKTRQWNVKSMKQYCEAQIIDQIVLEKEQLTTEQQYNEYVMTSLRTSWGCDTEHIYNVFGEKYARFFTEKVEQYIRKNQIQQVKSIYKLTHAGKLFADGIAAGLFHDF